MKKARVAIIGAGKVGSVLARALHSRGYRLTGIASSTLESARKLAIEFGALAGVRAAEVIREADIVFITVPDRCISQVVEEVGKTGGFNPGQIVIHTSGSMAVEILRPANQSGALIGCMHPLQSFANKELSAEALAGVYFALSGQEEMVVQAREIVKKLGGQSFTILDKDKALYHASACIVSNYLVSLMYWAGQIYGRLGLSSEESSAALLPLLQGTVKNIQEMGATEALTGPISRGDAITITAHLEALKQENEKKLYAELGRYTLDIALKKGTVDKEQAAILAEILRMDNGEEVP